MSQPLASQPWSGPSSRRTISPLKVTTTVVTPVTPVNASSDATVKQTALPLIAMLPHPLQVQATILRRPDFAEQKGTPEMSEEGDLLHDVLANPLVDKVSTDASSTGSRPVPPPCQAWGLLPALRLPATLGVYLTREPFQALVCFFNSAAYPLHTLNFEVSARRSATSGESPAPNSDAAPSGKPPPPQIILCSREVSVLSPKARYSFPVRLPLQAVGMHTLSLVVKYYDPSGTARRLNWATSFPVEQAITEVGRRVLRRLAPSAAVPDAPTSQRVSTLEQQRQDCADPGRHNNPCRLTYALTTSLQNTSSVALYLTQVQLVTANTTGNESFSATVAPLIELVHHRGFNVIAKTPQLLQPGDVVQCSFLMGIDANALQSLVVQHSSSGDRHALVSTRLLTSLSHFTWEWKRAEGEGGTDCSVALRLSKLLACPEMDLVVRRVAPVAIDGGVGDRSPGSQDKNRTGHRHVTPLRVGHPVRLQCEVVRYHRGHTSRGVSLKVKPEMLAPQWLYSGPSLLSIEEDSQVALVVTPWCAGWLTIAHGAIELVETAQPENVLWPRPRCVLEVPTATGTVITSNASPKTSSTADPLSGSLIKTAAVAPGGDAALVVPVDSVEEIHEEGPFVCVLVR